MSARVVIFITYTKFKDPWTNADAISADAMNHVESQYSELKAIYDIHNHDTIHYTKTLADATFFTLTYFNNFDADKLDALHYSDLISAVMPNGAIMLWHSTDGDLPSGWGVCNGSVYGAYTSPNLRDRFVIGAGGAYAVDQTGGPAAWNGTITPIGTVTVGAHTLTTAELPVHGHGYSEGSVNTVNRSRILSGEGFASISTTTANILNQDEGGDGSHGHPGSTAGFNAIDPRPAYYSLYYIIKYA